MDELESLSHTKWDCKYHVVFIPKCRRKTLYVQLRPHLGEVFRKLAAQKGSRIEEGHLMADHVHMMISIPPKYAVSQVVGFIKGKSAIHLARVYGETEAKFRRSALLGPRLLRFHSRARRAGDPRVHQEPGTGGQAPRTTQPVALICRL
jgi:putative transposase